MMRSCRDKCLTHEYGEAELHKGENVCLDRCFTKFYQANGKIGRYVQTSGVLDPLMLPAYRQLGEKQREGQH